MASTEEFKVSGDDVVKTIKKIVAEGNARRIIIKNEGGETLVEFPLTVGAIGAVLLPLWAAVAAIAALVAKCTIVVEKRDPTKPAAPADIPAEPMAPAASDAQPQPQTPPSTPPAAPTEGAH